MSNTAQLPDAPGEVSASVAEMQIAKIFASRHFRKADRLKRFLQFVTEETLKGRGERIKESLIGLAVFDRRAATYDPGVDPIVRVQAGRVRAKLIAYYEKEGADDDVLIEVPRGQYVPTFRMRPRHSPDTANGKTRSIDALNEYLKGRFYWNKRNQRGLRTAIHHFQEATRIDPDYARAHSGLADCYIMLSMSGAEAPLECMPFARRAALRAIEIDDSLAEAHTSLGAVLANFDWDRVGAEREFKRALELDPGYATLHHWYSLMLLVPERRLEEAEAEIQRAEELDPTSLPINLAHALVLLIRRDCETAIQQCNKVLGLDPNYYRAYWFLGMAYSRLGNFEAAIGALEIARNRGGGENAFHGRILGALGYAYARVGKPDRARAILDEMAAMSITAYVDPFEIAQLHLGLGETDAALDNLERGAEDRSGYLVYIGIWPGFEAVRSSARFTTLLSRLGLGPRQTVEGTR